MGQKYKLEKAVVVLEEKSTGNTETKTDMKGEGEEGEKYQTLSNTCD